jgi:hypothetical protein
MRYLCLALIVAALAAAGDAHAVFRAYLSPEGNDANPCTREQPCRLLPAALAAADAGGEVWMVDSANYNTATVAVTKSVTILAIPGALASLVSTGGPAIQIATPGIGVVLRNLVIVPLVGGGGTSGIVITNGDDVSVEKCVVANHSANGISVASQTTLNVTDSIIRGNADSGIALTSGARATIHRSVISGNENAVLVEAAASSTTQADIYRSSLTANQYGLAVNNTLASGTAIARASLRESQVTRNQFTGLYATSVGGPASISAANNQVTHNGDAGLLVIGSGTRITAHRNTVTHNNYAYYQDTGVIETSLTNTITDNLSAPLGSMTTITTD